MKTLYTYTLLLFAACLSLTACSDDDPGTDIITVSDKESALNHVMPTAQEKTTVQFTATTNWTATSDKSWCEVQPSSGSAGTVKMTITAHENTEYDQRTATITLKAGDAEPVKIVVTQVQKDAILVAKNEYFLEAGESTLDFDINTNVPDDFQVSISASWIQRVADTRGLVAVPLHFHVDANTDSQPREAVITVSKGDIKQEIRVTQAGYLTEGCIRITHIGQSFKSPLITGTDMKPGTIRWGDEKEESYEPDVIHTYSSAEEPHVVTFIVPDAEEISLQNLVGVTSLDLTNF